MNVGGGGKTGGEGGIRTLDRGLSPYNGLANRRLRPLGHLSGGRIARRQYTTAGPGKPRDRLLVELGLRHDRDKVIGRMLWSPRLAVTVMPGERPEVIPRRASGMAAQAA